MTPEWFPTQQELEASEREIAERKPKPPSPKQQRMLREMNEEDAARLEMTVDECLTRRDGLAKNPQLEAALQRLEEQARQREEMKQQAGLGISQHVPVETTGPADGGADPGFGSAMAGGIMIAGKAMWHSLKTIHRWMGKAFEAVQTSPSFHQGLGDVHTALKAFPESIGSPGIGTAGSPLPQELYEVQHKVTVPKVETPKVEAPKVTAPKIEPVKAPKVQTVKKDSPQMEM